MTIHDVNDPAPCVLYVDDYPVNVRLMEALFDLRTGFRLLHAGSPREAMAMRFASRPALMLLDLNLPDMHGSQLLGMLRRQNDWADVPAVAVTADHEFDVIRAGFCERWKKPLHLQQVLQRLQFLTEPGWRFPAGEVPQRPVGSRAQPERRAVAPGPG